MRINKIALSKLLKLEVPQLAKQVLEIVEKHNPEVLLVEKAFNDFSALEPEIESLIVGYGPHPLTPQIEAKRQKRTLYATSITFQVRGLTKGYIDGTEEAVAIVNHAVNLYLINLRGHNEEIINEKVDQFLREVDANRELEGAVAELGLSRQINDLRIAHSGLKQLLFERNASTSERPKGIARVAAKAIRHGMKMLFTRIEVAQIDNSDLDYTPLISELNEKLIRYSSLIKMRETILNNKKMALADGDTTEPTHMRYNLYLGDVSSDGFDQSMDQKRADASSSKLSQLPDVEKED